MKIDGGCHCGHLTYEAEIDPEQVGVCHCRDCQTFSGSAFRGFAPAIEGTFKLLSGEPNRYMKTAASGHVNAMVFCPDCGTHICSTGAGPGSTFYGIRRGPHVSAMNFARKCRSFAEPRRNGCGTLAQ
jgi:hypothetical protein